MSFDHISNFKPEDRQVQLIPEGQYRAWITSFRDNLDLSGCMNLTWLILDGPFKEKSVDQALWLKGRTEKGRDFAQDLLTGMLRSMGFHNGVSGWDDLKGRSVLIRIGINEYNGIKENKITGYSVDNLAHNPQQMPPQQMPPQQMPPQQMPPQQMPPQQMPPQQQQYSQPYYPQQPPPQPQQQRVDEEDFEDDIPF